MEENDNLQLGRVPLIRREHDDTGKMTMAAK